MAEARAEAPIPPRGVRRASVEVLSHANVSCFFSRYEKFSGGSADELKQDALDFHWTVNHIFQQQTVLPFRFPTLLAETSDLEIFLSEHAAAYLADLERLRDQVQMEVRLPIPLAPTVAPPAVTGTAYMKARFDAAQQAVELETVLKSATPATEWKHRANRYFALVARDEQQTFRENISALQKADIRVSGPWPPSEFVNCYPDLPQDQK